jgi:C4-dicarboxylate-binding protein DctP
MYTRILLAVVAIFMVTGTANATKLLRLTLQLPATHHLGLNIQEFADEVAARTNGEIKIEMYPSAQLYKDSEVPQAVASGAVEMGVASISQFAGTIPAVDLFYVPFLFLSQEALDKAVQKDSPVRAPLDEAILSTGTRVMWWQAYGGSVILSKGEPVIVPDDLKGKKVRVFSKTLGDLVNAAGGAPTSISGSEQFLAYQRGTVDVGLTGVTAVKSRKLYQVMDNLTATKSMVDIQFIVLINERVWQGLTDSQRAIMEEAAARVEGKLRSEMQALEGEAFTYVQDKMNVVELTEEQLLLWQELSAPVTEAFVKNAGPLGAQVVEAAKSIQ